MTKFDLVHILYVAKHWEHKDLWKMVANRIKTFLSAIATEEGPLG